MLPFVRCMYSDSYDYHNSLTCKLEKLGVNFWVFHSSF